MDDVPEGDTAQGTVKDAHGDELYKEFMSALWKIWAEHQRAETVLKPDETYRVLCQALISVSAVGAVDVGITMEQFAGMAITTWQAAHKAAPKFS